MPLIKKKNKAAFSHNIKAEMDAGKPQNQALAIAYSVKRRAKKMSQGGEVPEKKKSIGEIIGYPQPSPSPVNKARGGMIDDEEDDDAMAAQKADMEQEMLDKQEHNMEIDEDEHPSDAAMIHRYSDGGMVERDRSIAQAIRAKRMEAIQPDDPMDQLEDEFPKLNEEAADDVSEGPETFDRQNRIAAIRKRRMRGL